MSPEWLDFPELLLDFADGHVVRGCCGVPDPLAYDLPGAAVDRLRPVLDD